MSNDPKASASSTDEANARLFMGLFMASWSLGFVALFAAYAYLRLDSVTWPPAGAPPPPRIITAFATGMAVLSSGAYHYGLIGIEQGHKGRLFRGIASASVLSFVFLVSQIAAAGQAAATGLRWNQSAYAALFWIIAGFHFAHALVGCLAGTWLATRARNGFFTADRHLPIRLWGYYWHSIGAIWVLIYLLIFLS